VDKHWSYEQYYQVTRSTDCSQTALANLLRELIKVRNGLLVLPEWFHAIIYKVYIGKISER